MTAATALVGKVTTDRLGAWGSGTGGTRLFDSYYGTQDQFLLSYSHFDGDRGAVTLGNITLPLVGEVGGLDGGGAPLNLSLRGSTAGDRVGSIVRPTNEYGSSTDWIVASPYWDFDAGNVDAGAVSFIKAADAGNMASASNGVVSQANSMVSSHGATYYGDEIWLQTTYSYYLIVAPGWNSNAGAVTWNSLAAPKTGIVGSSNSLVGASAGDQVGLNVSTLSGSAANYVVTSPNWSYDAGGSLLSNAGALTLIGNSDLTGFVGAGNSLVGTHANDFIGNSIVNYGSYGFILSTAPGWGRRQGRHYPHRPGQPRGGRSQQCQQPGGHLVH